MRNITNDEVSFIDHDLTVRGIVLEELRDNLIDHICCIIEHESQPNEDFFKCYERVLPQFFKEELEEIQTETDNLLQFKNFYTMKKIMNISAVIAVLLIFVGAIFKTLNLPGTWALFLLGGFTFAFLFLPILIIIKLKDEESITDKTIFSFGLMIGMAISLGVIFKIMHWPYATNLIFYSTIIFSIIYVPLYFFTRIRRPDIKFNTIVNSVLMIAFGGLVYFLFDLGHNKLVANQVQQNHFYLQDNSTRLFETNENLYALVSESNQANEFQNATQLTTNMLNKVIEIVVTEGKSDGLTAYVPELKNTINNYNTYIKSVNSTVLRLIDAEQLELIANTDIDITMNVLARIQQQLAVNENAFLSKQIATK